ncbi:sensor domain-containing diguanylate cyclase [Planomicrobium sp. CPCC 101110]|uniref:sensor domain-containing diguanylate cyclase n=1 Tax=Planomicrobium sp. CPCC 101110 TaxID=2599619 RepID=UPI0011B6E164|nr:sensor domain-containing diguanylate cyclase [Planomicrobium sp. CPCC 101110]TWT25969.1 sensor domain-containing diguanylate cyclase [Planomicrobium sp. CPCC 101110]
MRKSEKEVYFNKIDHVVDEVFSLLSETIDVNSIFLTNTDRETNFIIKAFNRKTTLLQEGEQMAINKSLCKLVIENGGEPLVIPNIAEHPAAADHPGAERIKNGSYIGTPIYQSSDAVFGTLCAADTKPYGFSDYDAKLIKTLGLLLSQSIVLEEMMVRDLLTGLHNRAYLVGHFERNIVEEQKYAFLYVDLDRFKAVNDQYGHEAGDELLKKVASVFQELAPSGSIITRIGGDEFILLIPVASAEMEEAKRTANGILKELSDKPVQAGKWEFDISASVGMTYAEPGKDLETLMNEADKAMYEAKRDGRNTVRFH